jgi:hypothetical protein
MRKVRTNYDSLTQAEFDEFITLMMLSLTGNTNFPNLPKSLITMAAKQADWQKELSRSKQGYYESTTRAKNMHTELLQLVKVNGDYINNTALDNVPMLESSGYTLAKERIYRKKPIIKVVQGDHSGSGKVVIHAFPGAITYLVEFATDSSLPSGDDAVWKRLKLSTKCTLPFSGLEPLKLYWVRFCYLTRKGEADYSQPISFSVK